MSTAPAAIRHLAGWAACAVLLFVFGPGLVAADTKHDLAAAPAHFLAGAFSAYSSVFPFGQVQNQAYGYLFPQGAFFVVTDFLPDWVAQRAWWTILVGVGFSGTVALLGRLGVRSTPALMVGGFLYALSPRVLATLTTISSESWPVMLTPWVIYGALEARSRGVAVAVLAVAACGAVNATATLLAILPAGVFFLRKSVTRFVLFGVGCVLVSLWWLVPLLVMGRFSVPFVDFIESAAVTTRFSTPVEILRGTTHWVSFISPERVAGFAQSTTPAWVVVTGAVAVVGLVGLCTPLPWRGVWVVMLAVGVVAMAADYGAFLDGPGVALRNVHKWDPWVRLPLVVGVSFVLSRWPDRRVVVGVCAVAVVAVAPVWSGQLLPVGAYKQVPDYMVEAAAYVNESATPPPGVAVYGPESSAPLPGRVLVVPASPFAHYDQLWTRDEPLQPLLDVPWAVRDAIPLIPPETIRGLDGLQEVLLDPSIPAGRAFSAATWMGISRLVVRTDIAAVADQGWRLVGRAQEAGLPLRAFTPEGPDVDVSGPRVRPGWYVVDLPPRSNVVPDGVLTVAGGGEVVPLVQALVDAPVRLVGPGEPADIVTDTPLLRARNFGAVRDAASAPVVAGDRGGVSNRVQDYPSRGQVLPLEYAGGNVVASSSASDALAVGGARPEYAPQAAVDGDVFTAWRPAPGDRRRWLRLDVASAAPLVRVVSSGQPTRLRVWGASPDDAVERDVTAGVAQEFRVPGGPTTSVTVQVLGSASGVAEVSVDGRAPQPTVVVPDRAGAKMWLVHAGRTVQWDRPVRVRVDAATCAVPIRVGDVSAHCGQVVDVPAGSHVVRAGAGWVRLTAEDFSVPPAHGFLVLTGLAYSPGLEPVVEVGAGMAAAVGDGDVHLRFAGASAYRWGLGAGALLAVVVVGVCVAVVVRTRPVLLDPPLARGGVVWLLAGVGVAWALGSVLTGVVVATLCAGAGVARRWLAPAALGMGVWLLSHGAWTQGADYAGDSSLVRLLGIAAVVAVVCAGFSTRL